MKSLHSIRCLTAGSDATGKMCLSSLKKVSRSFTLN